MSAAPGLSLSSIISSCEVVQIVSDFLDPISMINLTLTSSEMYCGLPRNSSMSVNIWRKYLTDSRYLTNKLIIETARSLASSENVSRANFKCILAVLVRKNGFMKVSRLKSLCAAGKLSTPLLPNKGAWRAIIRLDQFALKRASKECDSGKPPVPSFTTRGSTGLDFISRIAGRKGKFGVVSERVLSFFSEMSDSEKISSLTTLLKTLVDDGNILGFIDVLKICGPIYDHEAVDSILGKACTEFNSILRDNFLHYILRDSQTSPKDKVGILDFLLQFSSLRNVVNIVNLNHVSPLVLISNELAITCSMEDRLQWQQIADLLIKHGTDIYLCDRKGNFYQPIGA